MPWLDERSFLLNGVLLIFFPTSLPALSVGRFPGREWQGFFAFGLPTFSCREQVWQTIKGLLLPLRDLGWMNPLLSGDLIGRFLPFDGISGHLRASALRCIACVDPPLCSPFLSPSRYSYFILTTCPGFWYHYRLYIVTFEELYCMREILGRGSQNRQKAA